MGLNWKFCASHGQTGAHAKHQGRERAGAMSPVRTHVHASPSRLRHVSPYHGQTSKFGREHGMRQHHTHLQAASRPVSPRATRCARARHGAVGPPATPARRGSPYPCLNVSVASLWSKCHRARSAIKRHPLLPRMSTAARRSAIATAAGGGQTLLALP
jgi:hypothetical protein